MSEKKTGTINARIPASLRDRLDRITADYGPSDAKMIEDALTALADCVEKHRRYIRPIITLPADEAEALLHAAEDKADYTSERRLPSAAELLRATIAAAKSSDSAR